MLWSQKAGSVGETKRALPRRHKSFTPARSQITEGMLTPLIKGEFTIICQAELGATSSELIGQLSMRRGIIVGKALWTGVLRHARRFLVLSVSTVILSCNASAADLRLRIDPAVARPAPSPKSRWQLFQEFLQWKKAAVSLGHDPELGIRRPI